jgi:transposase InsO family protein
VEYLSGFVEVDRLPLKTVTDIVRCLKQHFARHGLPDEVMSDNSPFNSAEFKRFATKYEFRHITSSPNYPQSNGKVENAIRTVKRSRRLETTRPTHFWRF